MAVAVYRIVGNGERWHVEVDGHAKATGSPRGRLRSCCRGWLKRHQEGPRFVFRCLSPMAKRASASLVASENPALGGVSTSSMQSRRFLLSVIVDFSFSEIS